MAVDLSDDEITVLMLSEQGQSIMAIARWEKPTDNLVAKGLLTRHDKFNHSITASGKKVLAELEKEEDESVFRPMATQLVGTMQAQKSAAQSAEQAAQHLLAAARASQPATGDSLEQAIQKWHALILPRALELAGK